MNVVVSNLEEEIEGKGHTHIIELDIDFLSFALSVRKKYKFSERWKERAKKLTLIYD
jgi:hypothetical protein